MAKSKHVYIVNEGLHDYTQASDFGDEVIILTSGVYSRVNVTSMVRDMQGPLANSDHEDWIMISGPPILNCIACVLFALRHGKLNVLIHVSRGNLYIPRTVKF